MLPDTAPSTGPARRSGETLESFCGGLSDAAQLKLALRLCRLALPLWDGYFAGDADATQKLNALLQGGRKVEGAAKSLNPSFVGHALSRMESNFQDAADEAFPAAALKNHPQLRSLFATGMQPLTNPGWDDALPGPVRLVFTAVWNILAWLTFKRQNENGETHIYVAVNQAADALMSGKILTDEGVRAILREYEGEARRPGEDAAWENAAVEAPREGGLTEDEAYRKIIGENIVKDPPSPAAVKEVLRQMREEDRMYWDDWSEYLHGACVTYSFDREKGAFKKSETDVIVGAFHNEYPMSEAEMEAFVSGLSLIDIRDSGFEV